MTDEAAHSDQAPWPDIEGREHLTKTSRGRHSRHRSVVESDPIESQRTKKELIWLLHFYEVPWPKTKGSATKKDIIEALRSAGIDPMVTPFRDVS